MRPLAALIAALALVLAPAAHAGGTSLHVGVTEDRLKQLSLVEEKAQLELLRLANLDAGRVTLVWAPGQSEPSPDDMKSLTNLTTAAALVGVKVYVGVTQFGSRTTPLAEQQRLEFAQYCAKIAATFPRLEGMIVGNEPNINRFWLPQFNPDGSDAAAPAFLALLGQTYDAIKQAQPRMKVYGLGLSPRGSDNPAGARQTHSPTVFLRDLGTAYRASGRTTPIMDGLAIHPYQDNSSQPPSFQHPSVTTISLNDYDKLVKLLGEAFDGTAQKGSTLSILYDEYGIESQIPETYSAIYTGAEPTTTRPADEKTQADFYKQAIALTFCQPNVDGILLFHAIDENELAGWQSGIYYADRSPKASRAAVGDAAAQVRRGVLAKCTWLKLTPKVSALKWPTAAQLKRREVAVSFTCDVDCAYDVRLERGTTLVTRKVGTATGSSAWTLPLRKRLPAGTYRIRLSFVAPVNPGATVTRTRVVKVP